MDQSKIIEILLKQSYITTEDADNARKDNGSPVDSLLSQQIINPDLLGQALSEFYKVDYSDLNSYPPSKKQVLRIPEFLAREYRAVVFKEDDSTVIISTDDPRRTGLIEELGKLFLNKNIVVTYSLPEDIGEAFNYYRDPLIDRFKKIFDQKERVAPKMIDMIIGEALINRVSDIHIEPTETDVIIRLRIDGILHKIHSFSKEYYENILNRIKIMAHLKIDEHFAHQDGGLSYVKDDKKINLRVSIVPTITGEKIAIRILSEYVRGLSFNDLGISEKNQEIIKKAIAKPFGMILVTGPTGSGKTTTLYSFLKILNQPEVNIMTIEDPVEYKISGVNQIKVNPQAKLDFAQGLRAIIRQDPDIILLGEIRDEETAEISVNAALIGHLLLSTFHANDAVGAIPRFLSMGIEPFLLSSTLEAIISQRLVRKICEHCRYGYQIDISELKEILPTAEDHFDKKSNTCYAGKGCLVCNNTGFKGRTGIFEVIPINQEIREMILKKSSADEIWKVAQKYDIISLFEDGIQKVKNGITTTEELSRIVSPRNN